MPKISNEVAESVERALFAGIVCPQCKALWTPSTPPGSIIREPTPKECPSCKMTGYPWWRKDEGREVAVEAAVLADEAVNHPAHYGGDTTYEVVKVLDAWGLDADFYLGNTIKYIARAGKKDGAALITDLEKAAWYLARRIKLLKGEKP